jgi:hypothetical protein
VPDRESSAIRTATPRKTAGSFTWNKRQTTVRNAVEGICQGASTCATGHFDDTLGNGIRSRCYTHAIQNASGEPVEMSKLVIVVHYHELWLKGGNRRFFLSKLHMALKRALEGLPVERILRPGDRLLIEFGEGRIGSGSDRAHRARVRHRILRRRSRGSAHWQKTIWKLWDARPGKKIRDRNFRRSRARQTQRQIVPASHIDIEVSVGQYWSIVARLRGATPA